MRIPLITPTAQFIIGTSSLLARYFSQSIAKDHLAALYINGSTLLAIGCIAINTIKNLPGKTYWNAAAFGFYIVNRIFVSVSSNDQLHLEYAFCSKIGLIDNLFGGLFAWPNFTKTIAGCLAAVNLLHTQSRKNNIIGWEANFVYPIQELLKKDKLNPSDNNLQQAQSYYFKACLAKKTAEEAARLDKGLVEL